MALTVQSFPSELGWMAFIREGRILKALAFGHPSPAAALAALALPDSAEHRPNAEDELVGRLQAYAAGEADDFRDVELDLAHLTAFQRQVVAQCRRIRWGSTLTYGELAARAGSSGAARAVGSVMACNRYPLIVPCHRVVGSAGSLGGYSAPDGLRMKRRLLELEGAMPAAKAEASTKARPRKKPVPLLSGF